MQQTEVEARPADATEAPERHEAIVVGAGPAGLAAAAMLSRRGVETIVLERADEPGASWRNHYDRLHLHTTRRLSGLPGFPIPRSEGRWVPRDGVVRYLQAYARRHRLDVRTGVEVTAIARDGDGWRLRTSAGDLSARSVVVATGFNRDPYLPTWPGADGFARGLLHSSRYRNPARYRGRDVMVVGTGNSGAEIAVDLAEGGARAVWLSVRTPPTILRRNVGPVATQALGVAMRRLPVRLVDALTRAAQRVTVGDLSPYGIGRPPRGMYTRAIEDESIPILDVGLIEKLRERRVTAVAALERFEGTDVVLADGTRLSPDTVIAATGFRRALEPLVGHLGLVGRNGRPKVHGSRTHPDAPGLYFIGYTNPISGNLRELGIDAKRIAKAVAGR